MSLSIEALLSNLQDADETTRRFAAEDLGDLRAAEAARPLAEALSDPAVAVREAAAAALVRIGGPAAVEAVLPALRSDSAPVRNAACAVLAELGADAVSALQALLDDESKDVRLFAVDVLARIRSPGAEGALYAALEDRDVNVAAAAAAALGEFGTPSAVGPLIRALKANTWVRCAVARSLGQIGGPEAVAALVALTQDQDEPVAFAAIQSLAELRDPQSRQHLERLATHANPVLAAAASAACERLARGQAPASRSPLSCGGIP